MEKSPNTQGLGHPMRTAVSGLSPACFALVMATGIISVASHLLGFWYVARPLLGLNIFFYLTLWVLTIARLLFYPRNLLADLKDYSRGVGFFTVVAGTCVLGCQFIVILEAYKAAAILWSVGMVLWAALIYSVFPAFMARTAKPSLEAGINGTWLLTAVATQSVSVLGGMIAPHLVKQSDVVLFFSFTMFLLGGMLYLIMILLIFYRLMFFPLMPEAVGPAYWINMGAAAISTLAGATLVLARPFSQFMNQMWPFTMGLAVFFWAVATWWIPLLLLLGVWRHLICHVKLLYDPEDWSLVFPLGMYTASTYQLAHAANLGFLFAIPRYFIFAALLAWSLTLIGLVMKLLRLWRAALFFHR